VVTLEDKDQRATEFSLAGRAEDVELQGFSQGELANSRERFIDRLLAGVRAAHSPTLGSRCSYALYRAARVSLTSRFMETPDCAALSASARWRSGVRRTWNFPE